MPNGFSHVSANAEVVFRKFIHEKFRVVSKQFKTPCEPAFTDGK
jgi:hypothetical protein